MPTGCGEDDGRAYLLTELLKQGVIIYKSLCVEFTNVFKQNTYIPEQE